MNALKTRTFSFVGAGATCVASLFLWTIGFEVAQAAVYTRELDFGPMRLTYADLVEIAGNARALIGATGKIGDRVNREHG